jgi:lysophospholipase L1-like esterase
MKRNLIKLFLGIGMAAIFFLLIEVALNLLNIPKKGIYDGDVATVWWLKPDLNRDIPHPDSGSFRLETNRFGLRGRKPPVAGEWILALGCSTTLGWGVENSENWTSLLSESIQTPVINGGMPGWSTHQASEKIAEWPEVLKSPSAVILAYWVRDAQHARRQDKMARPTAWFFRLQTSRMIGDFMKTEKKEAQRTARVSVDDFSNNLQTLISFFPNAEIHGLYFPQIQSAPKYQKALETKTNLLKTSTFTSNLFFPNDPVHLSPKGHRQLADELAQQLQ